jgi:hypothetical protein
VPPTTPPPPPPFGPRSADPKSLSRRPTPPPFGTDDRFIGIDLPPTPHSADPPIAACCFAAVCVDNVDIKVSV